MILEEMSVDVTLQKIQCKSCGGVYAISEPHRKYLQEVGGYWSCPYCRQSWGFRKESSDLEIAKKEAKRYRNYLAGEKARHDQTKASLKAHKASLKAHKAAKTRLKNRIAKGICPCCNRFFDNLQRHISKEHPNFVDKE